MKEWLKIENLKETERIQFKENTWLLEIKGKNQSPELSVQLKIELLYISPETLY